MNIQNNPYKCHRFPPEIIQYTAWLYYRFNLSHRDVEDLLAERGINVTRESVRLWCNKFGPQYAKRLSGTPLIVMALAKIPPILKACEELCD